jgi:hypothetical protein
VDVGGTVVFGEDAAAVAGFFACITVLLTAGFATGFTVLATAFVAMGFAAGFGLVVFL